MAVRRLLLAWRCSRSRHLTSSQGRPASHRRWLDHLAQATHDAPMTTTPEARRQLWARLDRPIASVRLYDA